MHFTNFVKLRPHEGVPQEHQGARQGGVRERPLPSDMLSPNWVHHDLLRGVRERLLLKMLPVTLSFEWRLRLGNIII